MLKETFRNSGTLGKLLQLFFITLFLGIAAMGIVSVIFGTTTLINDQKVMQLILSLFTFLIPPVVVGYLWYERPAAAYGLTQKPDGKLIFLAILLMIVLSPGINLLSYLNEQIGLPDFMKGIEQYFKDMEALAASVTEQMLKVNNIGDLMVNLLVMAVVPAFCEELYFRGTLQNIFSEKRNKHAAIWIVAIIFSLIHFQMYGFFPRMILGAVLGYLLVWSGSLWVPVIAHFTNNALAVLVSGFGQGNEQVKAMEEIGKSETYWYGIISILISALIIREIYKMRKKETQEIKPVS